MDLPTTQLALEDLPAYIYGPCCPWRHYLNLNRSVRSKWVIGYMEYRTGHCLLGINDSETIQEAAKREAAALERFKKHTKNLPLG